MTIPVQLDAPTFRQFGWYNAFLFHGRWKLLVIFFSVLTGFGILALTLGGQKEGATLLGTVLIAVAILVPGAHLLQFNFSLRGQCKKMGLKKGTLLNAYTLQLADGTLTVRRGKEQASYPLSDLHRVVYRDQCAYLYVAPIRAYLLPYHQIPGGRSALESLI